MNLEFYKKLPDRISSEDCNSYFKEVILYFQNEKITKQEFLEIILELTDRQIMTYCLLKKDLRDELDRIILALWNTEIYEEVDSILSIVVNLGLKDTYELVKKSYNSNIEFNQEVLKEIKECVEENGEDISNPYRFL